MLFFCEKHKNHVNNKEIFLLSSIVK